MTKPKNLKPKPQIQVTTLLEDNSRGCAWGNNHALLCMGKNSIAMGAAPDTIAQVGLNGVIALVWFETKKNRWRVSVGYAGENGIKAGTWYKLNKKGEFVETRP